MFWIDSYTWSFLFSFELMFDSWTLVVKFLLNSNSKFEFNLPHVLEWNYPYSLLLFKPCFLSVVNFVILWSLLCLLLLYKWLPSKVTLLSLIINVYFIGFQLFSEGKLYLSTSLNLTIAFHIEIISLVDGTYELIQEPDKDTFEVQVNIMEDNEDLNVNPKPKSELREIQPTSQN